MHVVTVVVVQFYLWLKLHLPMFQLTYYLQVWPKIMTESKSNKWPEWDSNPRLLDCKLDVLNT